jgi:hypothetical protein
MTVTRQGPLIFADAPPNASHEEIARREAAIAAAREAVRRDGFWFVDVPRTSSTSIRYELGRAFGPLHGKRNTDSAEHRTAQMFRDHLTAGEMRALLGPDLWEELYTFSIVRNPWDRAVSHYERRRRRGNIPDDWGFAEYLRRHVAATADTPYFEAPAFRHGAAEMLTDADGSLLVRHVVRFEDREAGLAPVRAKLGLANLGHTQIQTSGGSGRDYRAMYDDETRALIAERFANDIRLFDYTF